MEAQKPVEEQCHCNCDCGGECQCDGHCCKKEKNRKNSQKSGDGQAVLWHMRVDDPVGSVFLGILAILLLVFLVRSNKRNRELLLEVISLRRQP
jgi:hypothetical protein